MKKIKTVLMTLFVCALGYSGYTAYDYITMSDAEHFLLQNIEALTIEEPGGGIPPQICYQTFTVWTGEFVPYEHNLVCLVGGKCEISLPMIKSTMRDQGTCYVK